MIYGEDDYCTGIAAYNRIMARMKKVNIDFEYNNKLCLESNVLT